MTSTGNAFRPTIKTCTWSEAKSLLDGYDARWVFRGHRDARWELSTSLERTATELPLPNREVWLLREFKRRAHNYLEPLDYPKDDLEWLALMQHHGTPTRFMDWTRSPYIAAYFAFEEDRPSPQGRTIWAINLSWLADMRSETPYPSASPWDGYSMEQMPGASFDAIREYEPKGVFFTEPFRTNTRLTLQQGLFLYPGSLRFSFEENLSSFCILGLGVESEHPEVHKIIIPDSERPVVLHDTRRLNITRLTLFPGLDGLAQWLPIHLQTSFPDLER